MIFICICIRQIYFSQTVTSRGCTVCFIVILQYGKSVNKISHIWNQDVLLVAVNNRPDQWRDDDYGTKRRPSEGQDGRDARDKRDIGQPTPLAQVHYIHIFNLAQTLCVIRWQPAFCL